ncbi:MAG: hypothetical protein JNM89_16185 [Hyphomicrobiaceae bacterium]|nr:hypothetical protein [Hyphomicrobiaceae bacterium]
MPPSSEFSISARVFVFLVFLCLGLSFLTTTAVLAYEFRDTGWLDFVTMDSHLFLFFPTLGIVALVAFYVPSCAILDLYWWHIRYGKLRFALGALVIAGLSHLIAANLLESPKRSIWELSPATLQADQGEAAGCAKSGQCERMPALLALRNLREVSQARLGLADFVRDCGHDTLLESKLERESKRFCFASTPLSQSPILQTDAECCRAQERLSAKISSLYSVPEQRSLLAKVRAWILPLNVFFLLVLLFIGVQLVSRQKTIQQHYPRTMSRIELSVIIGAATVLLFPLLSQAFVQSTGALFGTGGRGTFSLMMPIVSLAFGIWALLLVLFFYRRRNKEVEAIGKMMSAIAGVVAVLKYSVVTAIFVRVLGSGASIYTIGALLALCFATVVVLLWPASKKQAADLAGSA